jgi:hypothetical protein
MSLGQEFFTRIVVLVLMYYVLVACLSQGLRDKPSSTIFVFALTSRCRRFIMKSVKKIKNLPGRYIYSILIAKLLNQQFKSVKNNMLNLNAVPVAQQDRAQDS